MMMQMIQADIDNGYIARNKPGNSPYGCFCPFAEMLRRYGFISVMVTNRVVHVYGAKPSMFPLPKKAQNWIDRFDNNEAVQPEKFQLPYLKERMRTEIDGAAA